MITISTRRRKVTAVDDSQAPTRRKPGPAPTSRDRLLDAACRVFATRGYAATSMSEIAEAAGVTRVTLYKNFSDKDAVFTTCFDREAEIARQHLFTAYDRGSELSIREEISVDMQAVFDYAAVRPDGFLLLNADDAGPAGDRRTRLGETIAARLAQQMSVRSGLDADSPGIQQLARMAVGVAIYGSKGAENSPPEKRERAARLATDFVVGGIAAVSGFPID